MAEMGTCSNAAYRSLHSFACERRIIAYSPAVENTTRRSAAAAPCFFTNYGTANEVSQDKISYDGKMVDTLRRYRRDLAIDAARLVRERRMGWRRLVVI
jgi:hypothetical protein